MRVCVRGTRALDFTTDNGRVKGTQIFYSRPVDGVIGEETNKIFIHSDFPLPSELVPGKVIDIFCDTKGHIEHIQLAASPAGK